MPAIGKAVIFSAPSGSGKTTIVKNLLSLREDLSFSISACSRPARPGEVHGKDYYFLSSEEFLSKVAAGEFIEWEEVYTGIYYGTLRSEIERIWSLGKHVIFDVDVVGGLNLKKYFGSNALAVYVKIPSFELLEERLRGRGTETEDTIQQRLAKAKEEIQYMSRFDYVLENVELGQAISEATLVLSNFLES